MLKTLWKIYSNSVAILFTIGAVSIMYNASKVIDEGKEYGFECTSDKTGLKIKETYGKKETE